MAAGSQKSWICTVCGYVHQGDEPPEYCVVCGAPASDFELQEPVAPVQKSAPTKWRCVVCDYVHEGPEPPDYCPVCGATREQFEPVDEALAEQETASSDVSRIVIIGTGIAGVSAAESARGAAPNCKITLIGAEKHPPYYRLNLTRYLAGEVASDTLPLHPEKWYAENEVDLRTGVKVEEMFPADHRLALSDNTTIEYDKLILAMGAHPFAPPISGADKSGVVTVRTVEDADAILGQIPSKPVCVCIGAGVLGLETAGALAMQGLQVTLLESHDWLMPRQLNSRAGVLMESHLKRLDIQLRKLARTKAIIGDDKVTGVELDDGTIIPADLVVITTGIRPDTYLARKAGIEVNRGIVVNNHLLTSVPDIFAAGDVAEHNGVLYGIWAPAQFQGNMAGMNAAGVEALFGGLPRANGLKVLGIDMLSIGQFTPEDGSYRVIDDEKDGNLYHFTFRGGKLIGSILLGDTALGAAVKKAIEAETDYSALLAGNPGTEDVRRFLAG